MVSAILSLAAFVLYFFSIMMLIVEIKKEKQMYMRITILLVTLTCHGYQYGMNKDNFTNSSRNNIIPAQYDTALKKLPPIIRSVVALDVNNYWIQCALEAIDNFFRNDNEENRLQLMYGVKNICIEQEISVPTTLLVLKACDKITRQQPVDLSDSVFMYDPVHEATQTQALINR